MMGLYIWRVLQRGAVTSECFRIALLNNSPDSPITHSDSLLPCTYAYRFHIPSAESLGMWERPQCARMQLRKPASASRKHSETLLTLHHTKYDKNGQDVPAHGVDLRVRLRGATKQGRPRVFFVISKLCGAHRVIDYLNAECQTCVLTPTCAYDRMYSCRN